MTNFIPLPEGFIDEFLSLLAKPTKCHLLNNLLECNALFTPIDAKQSSPTTTPEQPQSPLKSQQEEINELQEFVFSNITVLDKSFWGKDDLWTRASDNDDATLRTLTLSLITSKRLTNLQRLHYLFVNTREGCLTSTKYGGFDDALAKMEKLKYLKLGNAGKIINAIFPLNYSPPNLEKLDLQRSYLEADDIKQFVEFDGDAAAAEKKPFSRSFPKLKKLNFSVNEYSDESGALLIKYIDQTMPELTHLNIAHNRLRCETVSALVNAKMLSRLVELRIGSDTSSPCPIDDIFTSEYFSQNNSLEILQLCKPTNITTLLDNLSKHQGLGKLTELSLGNCGINDDHIKQLCSFTNIPLLSRLSFDSNEDITNESIEAIAQSPIMSNLTWIYFGWCRLINAGAFKFIMESPYLTKLTEIHCASVQLLDENCDAFINYVNSPKFANLTTLTLFSVPESVLVALGQTQYVTSLREVSFTQSNFTVEGLKAMCQSPYFTNLTSLRLSGCHLTPQHIPILTQAPHITQHLTKLDLSSNDIADEGIALLFKATDLIERLTHLNVFGNSCTHDSLPILFSNTTFCLNVKELKVSCSDPNGLLPKLGLIRSENFYGR